MTPWETDLLHAAAELARVKRLHAQTFLLGVLPIGDAPPRYRTDKQAWAAADEEHIEALIEAEARYEIAKSRLGKAGTDAHLSRDTSDPTADDPSTIEC